ncbi:MAG: serine/threonine protein kinase [Chitinophagales bacterium]
MVGNTIGGYTLTREIGSGGMAAVYEAKHNKLGHLRALKCLHPQFAKNAEIKKRFLREAKLLVSLDHPNIVNVIDYIEEGGQLAIVMELLEGIDLNLYIDKHKALPTWRAKAIAKECLSALDYVHSKGILHRDLKPSNLIVLTGGSIKIVDFGIAKLFGTGKDSTTMGRPIGTPNYMSPEQIKGSQSIDHRSDIYSLGVTLFYALKGKVPFQGDNPHATYYNILNKPLPTFSSGDLDFTKSIQKACEKDSNKRYQSCEDWLLSLQDTILEPKGASIEPRPKPTIVGKKNNSSFPLDILLGLLITALSIGGFFFFMNSGVDDKAKQEEVATNKGKSSSELEDDDDENANIEDYSHVETDYSYKVVIEPKKEKCTLINKNDPNDKKSITRGFSLDWPRLSMALGWQIPEANNKALCSEGCFILGANGSRQTLCEYFRNNGKKTLEGIDEIYITEAAWADENQRSCCTKARPKVVRGKTSGGNTSTNGNTTTSGGSTTPIKSTPVTNEGMKESGDVPPAPPTSENVPHAPPTSDPRPPTANEEAPSNDDGTTTTSGGQVIEGQVIEEQNQRSSDQPESTSPHDSPSDYGTTDEPPRSQT